MLFIPVMQSWIFCIIPPVFSVTWPFRNHCNMLIWCLNESLKEQQLSEIESSHNIIHYLSKQKLVGNEVN